MPTEISVRSPRSIPTAPIHAPMSFLTTQGGDARQQEQRAAVGEGLEVDAQADEGEEERGKGVERLDGVFDFAVVLGLGDDHAGEERADDRRQADLSASAASPSRAARPAGARSA